MANQIDASFRCMKCGLPCGLWQSDFNGYIHDGCVPGAANIPPSWSTQRLVDMPEVKDILARLAALEQHMIAAHMRLDLQHASINTLHHDVSALERHTAALGGKTKDADAEQVLGVSNVSQAVPVEAGAAAGVPVVQDASAEGAPGWTEDGSVQSMHGADGERRAHVRNVQVGRQAKSGPQAVRRLSLEEAEDLIVRLRSELDRVHGSLGNAVAKLRHPDYHNVGRNKGRIQSLRGDRRALQRKWLEAEQESARQRAQNTQLRAEVSRLSDELATANATKPDWVSVGVSAVKAGAQPGERIDCFIERLKRQLDDETRRWFEAANGNEDKREKIQRLEAELHDAKDGLTAAHMAGFHSRDEEVRRLRDAALRAMVRAWEEGHPEEQLPSCSDILDEEIQREAKS